MQTDQTTLHWSRASSSSLSQVPPALNRFSKAMDKNSAATLFKLLLKYKPEDKAAKKERLMEEAKSRTDGKQVGSLRPFMLPRMALAAALGPVEKAKAAGHLKTCLETGCPVCPLIYTNILSISYSKRASPGRQACGTGC